MQLEIYQVIAHMYMQSLLFVAYHTVPYGFSSPDKKFDIDPSADVAIIELYQLSIR